MVVQGAAHRLGDVAQTCGDQVAVRVDLIGSFGQSPGERVPMGAKRLNGIGAARGDPAYDVFRVSAGGAAGFDGCSRQTHGDGIALSSDRLQDLFAACVDPANDIVGVSAESACHGERRTRQVVPPHCPDAT